MKILLFTFATLAMLSFSSCDVLKNYPTDGFSISGNVVSYNNQPMAELSGIEFAFDDKKFVRELTFKITDGTHMDKIHNMIAFLHYKHPDYEIEVELPAEYTKIE